MTTTETGGSSSIIISGITSARFATTPVAKNDQRTTQLQVTVKKMFKERRRDISAEKANVIRKSSSLTRLSTPLPTSKSSSIHFNHHPATDSLSAVAAACWLPQPTLTPYANSAASSSSSKNSGFCVFKMFAFLLVVIFVLSASTTCAHANPLANERQYQYQLPQRSQQQQQHQPHRQRQNSPQQNSRNNFLKEPNARTPSSSSITRTSTASLSGGRYSNATRHQVPKPDWFNSVNHIPIMVQQKVAVGKLLSQNKSSSSSRDNRTSSILHYPMSGPMSPYYNGDLDYLSNGNMSSSRPLGDDANNLVDQGGAGAGGGVAQFCSDSLLKCITHSVVFVCMILCTVVGNSFVIAAVILERNLHNNVANYLIVSLASADLTVAIMVMPIGAYQEVYKTWTLGKIVCDIWTSFDVLCCTASILHLVAIAFDRYKAINNVDYGAKRTIKRILSMIITIWSISLTVAVSPHVFGLSYQGKGQCELTNNLTYQLVSTFLAFYLPLIVMCVIYWKIFQSAKFRIRKKAFTGNRASQQQATPLTRTANHSIASANTTVNVNSIKAANTSNHANNQNHNETTNNHSSEEHHHHNKLLALEDGVQSNKSLTAEQTRQANEANETQRNKEAMSPSRRSGGGGKVLSAASSANSFKSLAKSPSSSDKKLNDSSNSRHTSPGKHSTNNSNKKKKQLKKENTVSSYSEENSQNSDSDEDDYDDDDDDEEDDEYAEDDDVTSSSERANLRRSKRRRRKKKKVARQAESSNNKGASGNERIKKFIFRNKFLIKHLSSLQSKKAHDQQQQHNVANDSTTHFSADQPMSLSATTDLATISSIPPLQLDQVLLESETALNGGEQTTMQHLKAPVVAIPPPPPLAANGNGVNWSFLLGKMSLSKSANKVENKMAAEVSPSSKKVSIKNALIKYANEVKKAEQQEKPQEPQQQPQNSQEKVPKKLDQMKSFSTSRSLSRSLSRSSGGSSRSRSTSPKQPKEVKSPEKKVNFSSSVHPSSQLTPSKTLEICSMINESSSGNVVPLRSKLKKTKSQDDSHELYLIKGSHSRIEMDDSPDKNPPQQQQQIGGSVYQLVVTAAKPPPSSLHNISGLAHQEAADAGTENNSVNVSKLNDNLNNLLKTIISDELKDEEEIKDEKKRQNESKSTDKANESSIHHSSSGQFSESTTPPTSTQKNASCASAAASNHSSPRKTSRGGRRIHGNVTTQRGEDETGANTVVTFKGNNNLTSTMLKKKNRIDMKRERKAAKTLGVIMSCFIVCWLPFFLMQILYAVGKNWSLVKTIMESPLSTVLTWSGYLNSMLNPVIYTIFSPDFRGAFKKILFGKYHSKKKRAFYR